MIGTRFLKSLRKSKRGVTVVEFGVVAPVLVMTLLGIFDLGHRAYLNSVLYGAVQKAGRDTSLETAAAQQVAIKAKIADQISPVLLGSVLTVTTTHTKSFTAVASGEPFTDANANGTRDALECFDDENGNGLYDTNAATSGLGGTDDVVTFRAVVTFNHIFPFPSMIGLPSNDQLVATTVIRNQPYSDAATIAQVCT